MRRRPPQDPERQNTLLPTTPWTAPPQPAELIAMLWGMACWAAERYCKQYPGIPYDDLHDFVFDVLQQRADTIVAANNPQALGRTIAKGAVVDYLRKRSQEPQEVPLLNPFNLQDDDGGHELLADASVPVVSRRYQAARESGLDNDDFWWKLYRDEQVNRALDSLPERERKLIEEWKGFNGDKTLIQLAEESGYSTRYLHTLKSRALEKLGKHLADWNPNAAARRERNIWLATQREANQVLELVSKPDGYTGQRIRLIHEFHLKNIQSLTVPFYVCPHEPHSNDMHQDFTSGGVSSVNGRVGMCLSCYKAYRKDLKQWLERTLVELILEGIMEQANMSPLEQLAALNTNLKRLAALNPTLERLAAAIEQMNTREVVPEDDRRPQKPQWVN